jgi:tetratricopeptide (TPR) repeat protein
VVSNLDSINKIELLVLAQPANIMHCHALSSLYKVSPSWQKMSMTFQKKGKSKNLMANAFYNAGYVTKQKGEYQLAIDFYLLALDFDIEQPEEVYINLAVIYSENLRMENTAITMLKQALTLKEDFFPALYNLAGLFEEIGDKASAIKYYQRMLVIEPLDVDVLVRLSTCLHGNESIKLIKPLEEALKQTNLNSEQRINLNYALGKVLDDSSNYQQAFQAFTEANRLETMAIAKYSPGTQERTIDENIALFNKDWFTNLPVISTAAPIFICGMFRSGSTLLEQIISAHSEITAGGEIDFFDSFINRTDIVYPNIIKEYPIERLGKIADDYLDKIKGIFPDAGLLTDKRPDNFLYIGLIKSLFPNAQIIHTQRNPKDNCLAIYFQKLHSKLTYATNLRHIEHYYFQQQRLMSHWQSLFSDSFHVVNYEDLVSSPEQSTKGIFSKLNLHWQAQCNEFYLNKNSVKTASIWQVRQPLHKGSCNRWINYSEEINRALKED